MKGNVFALPCFFGDFMKAYRTVQKEAVSEFTQKKSRFICYVKPVNSSDEASEFIRSIKRKHFDASHNVSAFVLRDGNIRRSSDDGEPGGTAGAPVLDVLLKEKLVDVCVVITRYFGGTMLGAGGLIRAYSHGSKLAVDAGHVITMTPCKILELAVPYSFYDKLMILLGTVNAHVEDAQFTEEITVTFSLEQGNLSKLELLLTEHSNGKYNPTEIGEKFVPV